MKRILLLAFCCAGFLLQAHAQTIQLKITVDVAQLANPDCWLNQGVLNNNKVYIHSGLCHTDPQLCTDSICVQGANSVWQSVIGNWGQDDNIGLMTFEGNNRWSITMIPTVYYNQPGATPYTIGLVFRSDDGSFTGKDGTCSDIFIKGIHTANPTVVGCDNQPFPPVTVEKTVIAGIKDPSYLGGLVVSPNPFKEQLTIDYNLQKDADQFSVRIFNSLGQEVTKLASGSQVTGSHRLVWDGRGAHGGFVQNGIYYVVMADGSQVITAQKVVLAR